MISLLEIFSRKISAPDVTSNIVISVLLVYTRDSRGYIGKDEHRHYKNTFAAKRWFRFVIPVKPEF